MGCLPCLICHWQSWDPWYSWKPALVSEPLRWFLGRNFYLVFFLFYLKYNWFHRSNWRKSWVILPFFQYFSFHLFLFFLFWSRSFPSLRFECFLQLSDSPQPQSTFVLILGSYLIDSVEGDELELIRFVHLFYFYLDDVEDIAGQKIRFFMLPVAYFSPILEYLQNPRYGEGYLGWYPRKKFLLFFSTGDSRS